MEYLFKFLLNLCYINELIVLEASWMWRVFIPADVHPTGQSMERTRQYGTHNSPGDLAKKAQAFTSTLDLIDSIMSSPQ